MIFGENLKALRGSHSISQKELAEALGFSFQNISKWERNESLPDIETLIEIAKFFSTTTDALLGFAPERKFSTLIIDNSEADVYTSYPKAETSVAGNINFAVDGDGRITGTVYIPHCRKYKTGYIRNNYDTLDESSTLIYEHTYRSRGGNIVDNKRVRIPENGFLLSVSDSSFASKNIMKFIIPEEYSSYLDADTHSGYYNSRNGKSLFDDILKHNELDGITVELTDTGIIFKKPSENIDPMSVNIETLSKIVRKELQKERDRQIEMLQNRIDELEDMVDELESRIDELQSEE